MIVELNRNDLRVMLFLMSAGKVQLRNDDLEQGISVQVVLDIGEDILTRLSDLLNESQKVEESE